MASVPNDPVWDRIRREASEHASEEPILASFLHATILNHARLEMALSFHLANQLDSPTASSLLLREVMLEAMEGIKLRAIRRLDMKLIEANEGNKRGYAPIELYDLVQDPGEQEQKQDPKEQEPKEPEERPGQMSKKKAEELLDALAEEERRAMKEQQEKQLGTPLPAPAGKDW